MQKLVIVFIVLSTLEPSKAQNRTFLQLSDIHLDIKYMENAYTDREHFCHSHDGDGTGSAAKFGSYNCDSPKVLVESAFLAMKRWVPNPEFILWTGDSSAHDKSLNTSEVMHNLKFVTKRLSKLYPGVPIIPVLGNHDSSPPDHFPDSKNVSTPKQAYADYITDGSFGDLLNAGSGPAEQFKDCGYYVLKNKTYDVNVTQTFIVLNTPLYYHNNAINSSMYPEDPCGQLGWLNKTLQEAKPNENVFIVAHVPPGYFEFAADANYPMFTNEEYTKKYMDIITDKNNAQKIVAHFYGHTHTDSFRIFMDKKLHLPVGLAFIAPSITPNVFVRDGVNPSFRSYNYDHLNKTIISYDQYYLPLNEVLHEDDLDYEEEEEDLVQPSSDRRRLNSKMLSKRQVPDRDNNELPPLDTLDQEIKSNETTTEEERVEDTTEPIETTTLNATETDVPDEATKAIEATEAPIEDNDDESDGEPEGLAKYWQYAYTASLDFGIAKMDIKNMYNNVLGKMKGDPNGSIFKYYLRHAFVLRDATDGLDCNKTCIADIICTITNFVKDDFVDCIEEQELHKTSSLPGSPTLPAVTMTTSSPSPMTTTTHYWNRGSGTSTPRIQTVWTKKPREPAAEIGIQSIEPDSESDHNVVRGIAIGLALVALIALAVFGLIMYKKMKQRRYSSQEFLLDSFRYDGYSQIDQP